jgi:hypothetical protein
MLSTIHYHLGGCLYSTAVVNSGFSARLVTEAVRAVSIGVFVYALRKTEILKSLVMVC